MQGQSLRDLFPKKWLDDDLEDITIPVQKIVMQKELRKSPNKLISKVLSVKSLAVVFDDNTYQAAAARIISELEKEYDVISINLGQNIIADHELVSRIILMSTGAEGLVAVGSGTINDLCKYASFKMNLPYVVFPTAPSMNGYLSKTASLMQDGFKSSVPAHLPLAVFIDSQVMAHAPLRLIKSGVGDALSRPTAQADWLMSHLLLGTDYNESSFKLSLKSEAYLVENVEKIIATDRQAIEALMWNLLLSGVGMYIAKGSYPASQGEHMIAHSMEMLFGHQDNLHGEEIAVTSVTMAKLQEKILQPGFNRQKIDDFAADIMQKYLKSSVVADCQKQYQPKVLLASKTLSLDAKAIKQIKQVRIKSDKLEQTLKQIGLPTRPEEIGWQAEGYKLACKIAKFTRDRFTFLDLD